MTDTRGDRSTTAEGQVLLPRRAFLVECSSSETGSGDQLSGRVEHIVSGKATSFQSATELIDFMRRVLALGQVNPNAGGVSTARDQLEGPDSRKST